MIIAVDLGNTALTMGVYDKNRLIYHFFTPTDRSKGVNEYEQIFSSFALTNKINIDEVEGIILCSVVPSLLTTIKNSLVNVFKTPLTLLTKGIKTGLQINIDHPNELGADLVAVSVGGLIKYEKPLIIVDVGTATKMMYVDKNGVFQGVSIIPGIVISINALIDSAAQLMEISFEKPRKIIGKNTPDSLNSGAIYGTTAMIIALAEKIEKEVGYPCQRILTGGYTDLIKEEMIPIFVIDKSLLLDGLIHIYKRNKEKKND